MIFTTSWDDGSVLDLKIAHLLDARGMKGTFYIPKEFQNSGGKYSAYDRRLSEDEMRILAKTHEIGGHGLVHQSLTDMSLELAHKEIWGSKEWLDATVGTSTRMFCFPNGRFNQELQRMVHNAGYKGARTTRKLSFELPQEPYGMNVSVLINPYPLRRIDADHIYWRRALDSLSTYRGLYFSYPELWRLSWQSMARALFKRAYREGKYFHLYGHSWELERYGMWSELASFLDFVKQHDGIEYKSNGDI